MRIPPALTTAGVALGAASLGVATAKVFDGPAGGDRIGRGVAYGAAATIGGGGLFIGGVAGLMVGITGGHAGMAAFNNSMRGVLGSIAFAGALAGSHMLMSRSESH